MDKGVILDLETTGLDPKKDRIIEIGLLSFVTDADHAPAVIGTYSGIEDPEMPLSEEVAKLTGLSDAVLRGHKIRWDIVRDFLTGVSVVIAHNAAFDRAFVEGRPEVREMPLHWACSSKHINWRAHGHKTRALNYLAADMGFVNPFAHRALFDCATTFRIIAPRIPELIERSYMREFLLSAVGAPFEVKDVLRARGYRWNPDQRVWAKSVFEDELKAEREFLASEVYRGKSGKGGLPCHREDELTFQKTQPDQLGQLDQPGRPGSEISSDEV